MESDSNEEEEGQFEDIQTYLDHHNTYQESQNIHKEYTKRLLDLDDERYYRDIDHMYEIYPQDQAHIPGTQTPAPHHTMQELIQAYGRGRGQARREQLHGHRPFGACTRSLQSRIQRKIKKTQCMRQRYANSTFSEKGDQLQKRGIIFFFLIFGAVFFFLLIISHHIIHSFKAFLL